MHLLISSFGLCNYLIIALVISVFPSNIEAGEIILEPHMQFEHFMQSLNQTYSNSEEVATKFNTFQNSIKRIDELNKNRQTIDDAFFALTKFADLTFQEFLQFAADGIPTNPSITKLDLSVLADFPTLHRKFDWVDDNVIPEVRDHGVKCASSYAFASADLVAAQWAIENKGSPQVLSSQVLMDCLHAPEAFGCRGGDPFAILKKVSGCASCPWPAESCYPYESRDGNACREIEAKSKCQNTSPVIEIKEAFQFNMSSDQEKEAVATLLQKGPLLAMATVTDHWQHYTNGIMRASQCNPQSNFELNHAVLITGYDFTGTVPFYIIKNSWGQNWGRNGYLQMEAGTNTCGIASHLVQVCTTKCSAKAKNTGNQNVDRKRQFVEEAVLQATSQVQKSLSLPQSQNLHLLTAKESFQDPSPVQPTRPLPAYELLGPVPPKPLPAPLSYQPTPSPATVTTTTTTMTTTLLPVTQTPTPSPSPSPSPTLTTSLSTQHTTPCPPSSGGSPVVVPIVVPIVIVSKDSPPSQSLLPVQGQPAQQQVVVQPVQPAQPSQAVNQQPQPSQQLQPMLVLPPGPEVSATRPPGPYTEEYLNFAKSHRRGYDDAENAKRSKIYDANKQHWQNMNGARTDPTDAFYGDTRFADQTWAEFKQQIGSIQTPLQCTKFLTDINKANIQIPNEFDWTDKGVISIVRDQGTCGACYAFTAADLTSSQWAIEHNQSPPLLSPQFAIDCFQKPAAYGCLGGKPNAALMMGSECWESSNNSCSWPTESCYPYVGEQQTCVARACTNSTEPLIEVRHVPEPINVANSQEDIILATLLQGGPLVAYVQTTAPWQYYKGGIMMANAITNQKDATLHVVLITGYNFSSSVPYYIVKNSWGLDWGQKGFIYLEAGANTAGLAECLVSICTEDCDVNLKADEFLLTRAIKRVRGGGGKPTR